MGRVRVGILFGGRSGEHEVSLASARSIVAALDPDRFEPVLIGITKSGRWLRPADAVAALQAGPDAAGGTPVDWAGDLRPVSAAGGALERTAVDVIFPVLHGPNGEDGTIQGFLELAGVPYVGAGVLGSALAMDKGAMKDVFRAHGLPTPAYELVRRAAWEADRVGTLDRLEAAFGFPCFVKPCNLGSSVGITKAHDRGELIAAMDLAATYDRRIIVEAFVPHAREVECSVLGNDEPVASLPGEAIPPGEFYDYDAKYLDERLVLEVPAKLPPGVTERIQELAVRVFSALDLSGMARVDFFIRRDTGELLVNEANTIPGFTPTSMYPKMWEASGLPFGKLVSRLVDLALQRADDRARRRFDRG
ncbi:MAG TPA: D-alanine--D-alanine ligase family protein [Bacillota bacterium]|nr:D-alanine--D-alanine ligase family protein [Bacillota bacterium]